MARSKQEGAGAVDEGRLTDRVVAAFHAIARELGVPLSVVVSCAEQVFKRWRIEETVASRRRPREEKLAAVLELRREGLSLSQIAARLRISRGYVAQFCSELIRAGLVTRKRFARASLSSDERQAREAAVLQLRQDGLTYRDIAAKLDLSMATVQLVGLQLVAEGKVPKRLHGQQRHPRKTRSGLSNWRDLQDERIQLVIRLRSQGAILQEIGDALGVTRERARQILLKLTKLHGEAIFRGPRYYTQAEVARSLGIDNRSVFKFGSELGIPSKSHRWRLTEDQFQAIKARRESERGKCVICDQILPLGKRRMVCREAQCQRAYARQYRTRSFAKQPAEVNLHDWHRELLTRLQGHRIPEDDEWLTHAKAASVAGISKMQLTLLRLRRMLTTRPHPTVKSARRNGEPAHAFARSELELVREVYAAHRPSVAP